MDYTTCYCRSRQCSMFGRMGSSAQLKLHDWQRGGPRFRCQVCSTIVSASTGTAYVGVRTDLEIYRRGTKALAEGTSIRSTGRQIEVDKDTVNHWLPLLGCHCQGVMNYFFRNLHLEECQLDELWTFIYKKEKQLTALEKLAEAYGDAWVWVAFSPVCKLVPAWVVGKRTLSHARRLVFRLKSASDGQIPFFMLRTTNCLIMQMRYWKFTENKCNRYAMEREDGFLNRTVCRHQIYVTRWLLKSVSKDAWWKSPHALYTAQRNKSKRRYKHHLLVIPSIHMAWSVTT